jgi:hypothetical protein
VSRTGYLKGVNVMEEEYLSQEKKSRDRSEERESSRRGKDGIRTHAPIIISGGGSVDMEFDCDSTEHSDCPYYEPDDPSNPTTYTAARLRLDKVTVTVGREVHTCSHVTPNSTVVVRGRKDEFDDAPIQVIGGNGIVIRFDHNEYKPNGSIHGKKSFHHDTRKLHSLTILNPGGTVAHECPAIPRNGKCDIRIYDEH